MKLDDLPSVEKAASSCAGDSTSSMEEEGRPTASDCRSRRALIGPFSLLLALSGCDLCTSLFGCRESRLRAVVATIVFFLILGLFVVRVVFVMSATAPTLTYGWADSNIIAFTAVQSMVSLILLARWTATRMFSQVYGELTRVRAFHTDSPWCTLHSHSLYILGLLLSSFYVVLTFATSVKTSIYGRATMDENGTMMSRLMMPAGTFVLSFDNLFGGEIVIAIWMAIAALLATATYFYIHMAVKNELLKFNGDLSKAIEEKTLLSALESFNMRHIALLKLVALLNEKLSGFASISTLSIVIANINAFFQMTATGSPNLYSTIVSFLWMFGSMIFLMLVLTPPASIQQLLQQANALALNHNELVSHPEKISLVQLMVTRTKVTPIKMTIMNAIVVNTHTPHIITLMIPGTVAIMAYATRFTAYN